MPDYFEKAYVLHLAERNRRMVARYNMYRRLVRFGWVMGGVFFALTGGIAAAQLSSLKDAIDTFLLLAAVGGCWLCAEGAVR